ncbi:toll/interleukin-1 receptor domain-containing protein [Prosthecobacter sp.]|uniref:toll/interleukin-1 receptor domain-containing protein n=1 Tax=Prosthecobacter sp. TaxID=1965333 RepID=UPI002ABAFE18|nr:toll/interleukin-1 receptor domain-containing protein [Prosthecobacter sp.]MDZ4404165.1 toll/interleukin-1 receptor domain-containing protein [Prosthecobacter sp.]
MPGPQHDYRFDVAFSFAGPHRDKVRAIADLVAAKLDPGLLKRGKGKVFFDEWFRAEILGGNMRVLLQRIYGEQSLMVVADLSDDYADRPWCQGEAEAIDALRMRIDSARDETARLRVFIVRFGPGHVPGVLENTGWLDGINLSAEEIATDILDRLELLKARLAEGQERLAPDAHAATSPQVVLTRSLSDPPSPIPPPLPILFFHPATNDALYSRRERELAWLDDCAKDARIRIATVTGVGGLGKTSLVGHWIAVQRGWQHRTFRGVFFYSFYSDRDPQHFFAAFLQFVCEREKIVAPPTGTPLHHAAATAVRKWCYLVVLDGLEVLQRDENDPHYGWINDGSLNEFVARVGGEGLSLLVLTSRFPFPQITNEHPKAARAKELPLFDAKEGADLLEKCGLTHIRENLEAYSTQFGGHPLALRLFAGACLAQPFDEPETVSRHLLAAGTEAGEEDAHRRQFRKLLLWLQNKLPAPKRRLLQLVALFREPVPTATLAALATGLDAMKADFGDCDATHLRFLLDALVRDHLLQREEAPDSDTARWAAHPIVREVFRGEALASGDTVAQQFAEIVAGKGGGGKPRSVAELQPILEAIEVLLAAGNFRAAADLFLERLENGQVFLTIPAPQEGLHCARGFIEPPERRAALEQALGRGQLARYVAWIALLANNLGELDGVERGNEEKNEIRHAEQSWANVSIGLRNIAEVQTLRGALGEAVGSASEALFYAGVEEADTLGSTAVHRRAPQRPSSVPTHDSEQERSSRAYRAHALSLGGEMAAASRDFAAADTLNRKNHHENAALYSSGGIKWCSHRFRLGEADSARRLTEANRAICERNRWNQTIAQCDLLLGELDLAAGGRDSADQRIVAAVRLFREARQGMDLPDALLAQARLRGSVEDCEEALRLAARSGLVLKQCDALNLRARLRREAGQPADAAKDARDALEIAERCGYYWGRHEALRQLRDAAQASGNRADEKHWDEAEKALAAKMQPEIEEALRINREHDTEMEKLYGKKKRGKA